MKKKYIWANTTLWCEVSEGVVYCHHTDHLGTTEVVTDQNGTLVWEEFFDNASGLYYFNARWYDSELGKFTTQDPIRDGINWWNYCNGNPVRFVDPTGEYTVDVETNTIIADINDEVDMSSAAGTYLALQYEGFTCKAIDSDSNNSITFNNARSMYAFMDGTYNKYYENGDFYLDEYVADMVSILTATAAKGSFSGKLNKGLTHLSVITDAKNIYTNFKNKDTLAGINSSVDMIIDAVGYAGTPGTYLSIGLKYTKKGFVFAVEQMAEAEVQLEKRAINKWIYTLFGTIFK